MTAFQVLIIIAIGFALLVVLILILASISKVKNSKIIHDKFVDIFGDNAVHVVNGQSHQYEIETDAMIYLIKVIHFNSKHELIITNPYFWCVNESIKNWKRSSAPNLISGVNEFVDMKVKSSKQVVKVGLIYPDCHNITRYLNESDVELVTYKKSAYGVYFVRFSEFNLFFKN